MADRRAWTREDTWTPTSTKTWLCDSGPRGMQICMHGAHRHSGHSPLAPSTRVVACIPPFRQVVGQVSGRKEAEWAV